MKETVVETVELLENDILEEFFCAKLKVVHEKDAFLFSDLLEVIKRLSELSGLTESIITNTRTLKRRIIGKFSDDISFYPKDKYLIVHKSAVNPCEYNLAILKGKGLKDYDISKSFGEMIRREIKINTEEMQSPEWAYSLQEIVEMLDKGTLPEIYFTIQFSVPFMENMLCKYGMQKTNLLS